MNLANKITIFRIILIPVFLACMLIDFQYNQYIGAIIFIIAASTDALDGYIARKRKEITNFGKFVDPLADKLLTMAALVVLVEKGKIPALFVIIILTREFMITGLRTLAASDGVVIAASWWGKLKTVTQMIAIVLILLDNFPFSKFNFPLDKIMLYIAVGITVISGIDYMIKGKHLFYERK
mgnify:CR=1 FL=1